jgi:hypothetical protein
VERRNHDSPDWRDLQTASPLGVPCRRDAPLSHPQRYRRVAGFSASVVAENATSLDNLSLEEIRAFRKARVAEHAVLGLFPTDYDPSNGPSRQIWARVQGRTRWLGPTAYYVANPYQLVVLTCAGHVTPLSLICPGVEVRHADRRITETYRGDPSNVTVGMFSQPSVFHVGRHKAYNISPQDPRGWVRIASPGVLTRVVVKPWKEPPGSPQDDAELTYAVAVSPGT